MPNLNELHATMANAGTPSNPISCYQFRDLRVGATFDFVGPLAGQNSFFDRCEKIGSRSYKSLHTGALYTVGRITSAVYHVDHTTEQPRPPIKL